MRRFNRTGALAVLALAAVFFTMAGSASAQLPKVCFPVASDVPGLSGPNAAPSWLQQTLLDPLQRPILNEPRWAPGPLTAFYNDNGNADTNEGGYRLVLSQDRKTLSVSIQNKADDEKSNADGVSFGIYRNGFGRAVYISLRQGTADPNYYAASQVVAYQTSSTSDVPTVWEADGASAPWIVPGTLASWSRSGPEDGGADWAIQFKVNLEFFNITGDFQTHIGMRKAKSNIISPFYVVQPEISSTLGDTDFIGAVLPVTEGGVTVNKYVDTTGIPSNAAANWTHPNLLTQGCPNGLEFRSSQLVGTVNADGSLGNTVYAGPNKLNTFVGRVLTNGTPIGPDYIQAKFSIANWGAQVAVPEAKWSPLDGGTAVRNTAPQSDPGYATLWPESGGNYVEMKYPCTTKPDAPARSACGVVFDPGANADQCMLVQIQAVGGRKIPIKTASIYRNMRFVGLSYKELPAEISIKGLTNRFKTSGPREVYMQVITRNMPKFGDFPIFLDSYLMNILKLSLVGVANSIDILGLNLSFQDMMKTVWPTYEVHTYWDTRRLTNVNGKTYKIVSPMNSFGYYFSHSGALFGYRHGLTSTDASFKTPQPNFHSIRVGNEGAAQVRTAVSAEEVPRWLVGTADAFCRLFPWACAPQ